MKIIDLSFDIFGVGFFDNSWWFHICKIDCNDQIYQLFHIGRDQGKWFFDLLFIRTFWNRRKYK